MDKHLDSGRSVTRRSGGTAGSCRATRSPLVVTVVGLVTMPPLFGGIVTSCAAHATEPRSVVRPSRRPTSRLDLLSLHLQRRFRKNTRRHAAALRSRNRAYRLRSALPRRDAFAFGRSAASSSSIACASAVSRASSLSPFVSSTKATSSSDQHDAPPGLSAQPGQRDDVGSPRITSSDHARTGVQPNEGVRDRHRHGGEYDDHDSRPAVSSTPGQHGAARQVWSGVTRA